MWRTFQTEAIVYSGRCTCEPQEASRGKSIRCTKGKVLLATAVEGVWKGSLERAGERLGIQPSSLSSFQGDGRTASGSGPM